jgi:hypothetical protein
VRKQADPTTPLTDPFLKTQAAAQQRGQVVETPMADDVGVYGVCLCVSGAGARFRQEKPGGRARTPLSRPGVPSPSGCRLATTAPYVVMDYYYLVTSMQAAGSLLLGVFARGGDRPVRRPPVPALYVRAADLGGTAACCRRTELPPRPPGVIRVFLSHGPRASSATAAGHWRLGRHNSAGVQPHACVVQDDPSSAHACV